MIHDAQYTLAEFPDRAGWGHTPVERAVDYAILARAKRLALFHHDPDRRDELVDEILETARQRAASAGSALEIFAAAEGRVIDLSGDARQPRRSTLRRGRRCSTRSGLAIRS